MRAVLVVGVAILFAGCSAGPQASVGNSSSSTTTTTVPVTSATPGPPQTIAPSDAGWPEVALDASQLSNVTPRWLRLETSWSMGEPRAVNAALFKSDGGVAPLGVTATRGSASYGPGGDPNRTLSLNLNGGLSAVANADPSLVATKTLSFAGARVDVRYLTRNLTIVLTGTSDDAPFEVMLSWPPRHANQTTGPLYAGSQNGTIKFGMLAHPGGNIHPLEDAALLVWAAGDRVLAAGQSGEVRSNASTLDVLVLTGMDGWVERVAVEPPGVAP